MYFIIIDKINLASMILKPSSSVRRKCKYKVKKVRTILAQMQTQA